MTIVVVHCTITDVRSGLGTSHWSLGSGNNVLARRHQPRCFRSIHERDLVVANLQGDTKFGYKSLRCGREQCWDGHQICTSVKCQGVASFSVLSDQKPESAEGFQNLKTSPFRNILCLSNGHGEDAIAVAVLQELKMLAAERSQEIHIEALPLVGLGSAYTRAQIPTVGPARTMPSGGFIYMDILQLLGDLSAGLLSLTIDQWRVIARWVEEKPNGFIIAVGDVFPLALARLAARHSRRKEHMERGVEYAFVGTAKSEFYLQSASKRDNGLLASRFNVESLLGGVYLPWERVMMADSTCRLVAPRDNLTAEILTRQLPVSARHKVHGLGNPMMDGLEPSGAFDFLEHFKPGLFVALLPGSRPPEVYANWSLLLEAATQVSRVLHPRDVIFLTPAVPSLTPEPFYDALTATCWLAQRWVVQPDSLEFKGVSTLETVDGARGTFLTDNSSQIRAFRKRNAILLLALGGFRDICHWAEAGIAMAGTGTEQLAGLGKPVFTLAGGGPQFTDKFAEAQSRLLGLSVFLCKDTLSLATKLLEVISDKELLSTITDNGIKRMGKPGAGRRIAEQIISILQQDHP